MPLNRYKLSNSFSDRISSSRANIVIRRLVKTGVISTTTVALKQGQRLDHLAHQYYRDGTLWWVIAAASGIGWWLQVPPGTLITIPINLNEINSMLGE